MHLPDYGKSVEAVGGWIASGARLTIGQTAFMEVNLPDKPDAIVSVFESAGLANPSRNLLDWNLTVVSRAAYLKDARALIRSALNGAVVGFEEASEEQRAGIVKLAISALPKLAGRDERGRVLFEAVLLMTVYGGDPSQDEDDE